MTDRKIPAPPSVRPEELPLSGGDAVYVRDMLEGYFNRMAVARGYQPRHVLGEIRIILAFIRFVGKGPWDWREKDFDEWCRHLSRFHPPAGKPLSMNTPRKHTGAVRRFFAYGYPPDSRTGSPRLPAGPRTYGKRS
ncbi:MAG: hypothetical protein M1377_08135 [Deltaproteobacteria bacterium]|nr:hypothetical protein [Deltaproteobacteria bacterium]